MSNFKGYPIYKKRDGQSFKRVSHIYTDSFDDAKKMFAKQMTSDNHNKSNNIVWIDKTEGIDVPGWYDLDGSIIIYDDKGENFDFNLSLMSLFCSESDILEGFDKWNEDVYIWEVRNILSFEIYQDGVFFENYEGESLKDVKDNFPIEDGFTIIEII